MIAPHFKQILEGRADLPGLQQATAAFTLRVTEPLLQAKQELSGLRLIGSAELVGLIAEYTKVHAQIIDTALQGLSDPGALQELKGIRAALAPFGQRSKELYDRILVQMREELGIK